MIILNVVKGTPADTAGLRGITLGAEGVVLGDILVGIDRSPVGSYDDFYNALDEHRAGDEVDIKILRGGKVVTARVSLVALGPAPQRPD